MSQTLTWRILPILSIRHGCLTIAGFTNTILIFSNLKITFRSGLWVSEFSIYSHILQIYIFVYTCRKIVCCTLNSQMRCKKWCKKWSGFWHSRRSWFPMVASFREKTSSSMCASITIKSRGFAAWILYCAMCARIFSYWRNICYICRDGNRKSFVRCFTNVLRANNEGGKQKPASNITTWCGCRTYEGFVLAQNNFQVWLRVWKMVVPEGNEKNNNLLVFARETKARFNDLVGNEIEVLQSVKVSFGLKVKFSIERNGETEHMEHYFREDEPHIFNRHDEELIKQEFDRFVERTKGEIESWSVKGSGWVLERIMVAYVNVAR